LYPQSSEILLNLSTKCWNSAFNAQGSSLTIVIVQVGAMKIYVGAVEALRTKERQDVTQLPPKLGEKLVWVPVIPLCKIFIFIPSYTFDVLLPRNWPFLSPNHQTLQITQLSKKNFGGFLRIKTSHYSNLNKQGRFWNCWLQWQV
jgi:hypothetical protein